MHGGALPLPTLSYYKHINMHMYMYIYIYIYIYRYIYIYVYIEMDKGYYVQGLPERQGRFGV